MRVCIVERVGEAGRDEMTVMVEMRANEADRGALKAGLEERLREVLGVRVSVTPVERGGLDAYTGTSQTPKNKRVLDKRRP